ncbi:NAD(P)-dependent oxidoreductase [Couchioplanes caeruleus]|uniref:NAD-dependent epimerase/dehydratase family protein n=1 Tax=Couchioplanes caeruleus TaxID=56438 RepID=UPI0020C06125|nr:NAD(P)-dependent oxidoreductase [Couchioplanes caeruleus]UQU67685.1 NAD(P)-dependent oxidoreductase [Couchioplanes caeruleus]
MSVVVVGGAGFLGRAVASALASAGTGVVSLARTPRPGVTAALDLARCPPAELAALLEAHRTTAVVNAAGAVWTEDPEAMRRANVAVVETIRDAVAAVPWPVRVVQLGTVFEYAQPATGRYLTELSPCVPASDYGRTKLRASEIVLAATRDGLLDGVVLRLTTCAGPGMPPSSLLGRVAGELRRSALTGVPARLRLAPLTAERDFVDLRDAVSAVSAAITAPVAGAVLNVGSGRAVAVRQVVRRLIEVSGVPARVDEAEVAAGRSAGVPWLATRIGEAGRRLGWRPRHDVVSMVEAIWATVDPRASSWHRQAEEVT